MKSDMVISESERIGVEAGLRAFNSALKALGKLPLGDNPDFIEREPMIGLFPNWKLVTEHNAPLSFLFSSSFEVWLGHHSELLTVDPASEHEEDICSLTLGVLSSTVHVTGKTGFAKRTRIAFDDGSAWHTVTVLGPQTTPTASYPPYVHNNNGSIPWNRCPYNFT